MHLKYLIVLLLIFSIGCKPAKKEEDSADSQYEKDELVDDHEHPNDTTNVKSKTSRFGAGKLRINYSDIILASGFFKFAVYDEPHPQAKYKEIQISWIDEDGGYVKITNDYIINIRDYFVDKPNYTILFDCLRKYNGFYEVVIDEAAKTTAWIDDTSFVNFLSWEDFLKSVLCLQQKDVDANPIRTEPSVQSEIVMKNEGCLELVQLQGDWAMVKLSDLDYDLGQKDLQEVNGWIRWKNNDMILIEYFLTE